MTLWHRIRVNMGTLLIVAAALAISWVLLGFYLDERSSLLEQRDEKTRAVTDGFSILQRQSDLRQLTARMRKSVAADSSAGEGQLLHIVHDWEQRAGANDESFQRVGTSRERGFTQLTFEVSATGDMSALAALIYQMETASIPLRVENVQIGSKNDSDGLQIRLEISTLCRSEAGGSAELARGPG